MKTFSFITLAATLLLASCGGNKSNNNEASAQADATNVITVDSLLSSAESLIDKSVTIEGVCSHACKHGARKIFVLGSNDDNIIRCEAAALGAFNKECMHSVVRVTGIVRETRLDEAYLQRWKENYELALAQQRAEAGNQYGDAAIEDEQVSTSSGCETESRARGEQGNSVDEKIAAYRAQIAARKEAEGKEYLSFFHIETTSYEIRP